MADETMRFFGDAELVRYLDGELDEQGRARLESAIAAAPAVQARLEQLRRRGEALRERLREADPHVPERLAANPFRNGAAATAPASRGLDGEPERGREVRPGAAARLGQEGAAGATPRFLRAAVVVLIAGAVVALVPPLRALAVSGIHSAIHALTGSPAIREDVAPGAAAVDTIDVSFAAPATLEFELAERQQAGTLRIRVADVEQATVLIQSRTRRETFTVVPGGIHIGNVPESVADYELIVPAAVQRVRVVVGGEEVGVFGLTGEGERSRVLEIGR